MRTQFVERFGEDTAARIEAAAFSHRDPCEMGDERGVGSDRFRWAILVAISYECIGRFRGSHGIAPTEEEMTAWLKQPECREWLGKHDGDVDYLAVFSGAYSGYMPDKAPESTDEEAVA